jgi:hypothetical protein
MLILLIILAATYAATLVFDFRLRLKESPAGEKALYLALMAISVVPLILNVLAVPVPSPAKPIVEAVRAIFHVP